jgi:hypothetical protein
VLLSKYLAARTEPASDPPHRLDNQPRQPRDRWAIMGDVLRIPVRFAWPTLALVAAVAAAGCAADTAGAQDVNPQARALREFGERVRAYVELRATLAKKVATVSQDATPEQIARHQEQLAAAIREARKKARPGDIFTPPVVPQFRTVIRRDLQGRDIRDALAAMQDVPIALTLAVNMPWPADAPRAAVPPRLLTSLYPLPDGLEYRFLDRHLVLLDDEADLVVDYIRDVVPSVIRRRH